MFQINEEKGIGINILKKENDEYELKGYYFKFKNQMHKLGTHPDIEKISQLELTKEDQNLVKQLENYKNYNNSYYISFFDSYFKDLKKISLDYNDLKDNDLKDNKYIKLLKNIQNEEKRYEHSNFPVNNGF